MTIWEAIWKSIVLGTVQGLTEFLPVSSSGHLVFLQKLLGYNLEGGGMTFVNVMLHLGTLLAVLVVFRKDIVVLFRRPLKPLLMLVVATIPAGIVGLLFDDKIEAIFAGEKGLYYLSICFAATALMLLLCEVIATLPRMTGMLMRKENFVTSSVCPPATTPAAMVEPLREMPGKSATACTSPIGTVLRQPRG